MTRLIASLALAALVAAPAVAQDKPPMTLGSIERKDPRLDKLIPKDAKIEVIAAGMKWSEGPVWDKKQGAALQRHPEQPGDEVVAEGWARGVPEAERLYRQGGLQGG